MTTTDVKRGYHLRSRYGITQADYDALLDAQRGRCAGCGEKPRGGGRANANRLLFVDHDHETGAIRGLLCQPCNAIVGLAYERPATLIALVRYLARPPAIAEPRPKRPKGEYQKSKTHCRNGHPYSPENTYVAPATGHRQCRTCRRRIDLNRRASANGSARITELT